MTLSITTFSVGGNTYNAGTTVTIANVGTIIILSDGNFTFVPLTNYNGTVPSIDYTARDGNQGTDVGTLFLTVTPVNDLPLAVDDAVSTNENTAVSGNVLTDGTDDSDVDGNTLRITQFMINGITYNPGTVANIPGVGSITMNANGSYTFTPTAESQNISIDSGSLFSKVRLVSAPCMVLVLGMSWIGKSTSDSLLSLFNFFSSQGLMVAS